MHGYFLRETWEKSALRTARAGHRKEVEREENGPQKPGKRHYYRSEVGIH